MKLSANLFSILTIDFKCLNLLISLIDIKILIKSSQQKLSNTHLKF